MPFTPSKYQQSIFQWAIQDHGNLVVQASAGSGKTTTLEKLYSMLSGSVLLMAFNKSIADELAIRLPNATVGTYHKIGLSIVSKSYGRVQIDNDKNWKLMRGYLGESAKYLQSPIKKLASMVKNNLTNDNDKDLWELVEYYGIELNGNQSDIFATVRFLIQSAKNNPKVIDFDDMIWLPNVLDLKGDTFDWILVDELQDTNKAQSELISRVANGNSRVVGVGDPFQSIYAFRGANSNAIDDFISRWNAQTLPLSITYRNPKSVVSLVNDQFPDIPLECWDNAQDGLVEMIQYEKALEQMSVGDMILCRVNADLVAPCFQMIRKGVKAVIRGRDIGSNLASLVRKMKAYSMTDLFSKLDGYYQNESAKLLAAEKEMQLQNLTDKVNTIYALSDGINSVDELLERITSVFSDDNAAIMFSSIHKAKGLEADRVFILRPDLLPHPMAKKSWERTQERNLEYVCYTRSKRELYLVGTAKDVSVSHTAYIA